MKKIRIPELDAVLENIWVPNSLLPERYHDTREGGRSLARINEKYNREIQPKFDKAKAKAERIERLNRYRDSYADDGNIAYEVDEIKQNNAELAFVSASGIMEED